MKPLIEYMKMVTDPREAHKIKHNLAELLTWLVCGYLCGRTTIRRCVKWAKRHETFLKKFLRLENGIASPATVSRILSRVDDGLFECAFMEWTMAILRTQGRHIAIDGKALRAACSKVKGERVPMVLNALDVMTGLIVAQTALPNKDCEITAIPRLLDMLYIKGSVITTDAIGTQTAILEQILSAGGSYVMMVKGNQPESYEEIQTFFEAVGRDYRESLKNTNYVPKYPESLMQYDEVRYSERNRDRYEFRTYRASRDTTWAIHIKEKWPSVKTIGQAEQVRILKVEGKDGQDVTPDLETFLREGSARQKKPEKGDSEKSDAQVVGLISDMELTAVEMGKYKRDHWSVENCLHHVLDDSFREDRSPAKGSKNNLALIRKIVYNIIRLYMIQSGDTENTFPEMMDLFADSPSLIGRYVFQDVKAIDNDK